MKKIFFIMAVLLPLFVFTGCSKDDDEKGNDLLEGTTWLFYTHNEYFNADITYVLQFSEATYKMTLTTEGFEENPYFPIEDVNEEEIGSYTVDYPHVYLATNKSSHTCLLVDDKLILYQDDDSEMVFNKQK